MSASREKASTGSADQRDGSSPFWTERYPKQVPASIEDEIAKSASLLDVFDESCRLFTSKPAFTNLGKTYTFGELNRKAESFAAFLQNELKMKKGDRIAIQMPNTLQYPVAIFGSLKAGLVIVNTNPLYTEREMKHQFNDSGATAIVILANFAHLLGRILPETKIRHVIITELGDLLDFPKRLIVNTVLKRVKKMVPAYSIPDAIDFRGALAQGAALTLEPVKLTHDDIAFLQYTGGTTGVSKGAMLTHRNLIANLEQMRAWMRPKLNEGQEIGICALPLYHIFALTLHALALFRHGVHNVLITNPKDISALAKEMGRFRFNLTSGVNTLFNALNHNPEFAKLDFSNLKVAVAGGMALQTTVAQKWKQITGVPIVEGYGLTETSPVVCVNPIDGTDRVGTIGLPVPSVFVKMIDEDGREVPLGEAGELCVKGPQVMKGYWQHPEETAKVMLPDGWIKTGDVGLMEKDGFCRIVDRKKDMILVSGFNVYPNEVEDVIASHPGVLEVCAVGVASEKSGEIVKVFVVRKDPSLTAEQIIHHARTALTSYKVPKEVEFRTDLPKSNIGKILRRALR